jgi:hypothetical protein
MGAPASGHWYIVEGSITDLRLNETFTAGMYACRPPGMAHGPWRSEDGCPDEPGVDDGAGLVSRSPVKNGVDEDKPVDPAGCGGLRAIVPVAIAEEHAQKGGSGSSRLAMSRVVGNRVSRST